MLNRTNLTLSASTLSNGLNLGTRSLVARAGINSDGTTFHICPSHQDVMRERVVWYVAVSIPKPKVAMPSIQDSDSIFPVQRRQMRPRPAARAAGKSAPALRPATTGK